jgi:hypothetical protein
MNYFNRLARLPYENQRNAAYQAAASRRLAEKEAAAKAKADAEAEAARIKAEEEAKARAQAKAKPQNAYQQGVQQGYHQVECKPGEECSIQGGTRRRRKIKRRSKTSKRKSKRHRS